MFVPLGDICKTTSGGTPSRKYPSASLRAGSEQLTYLLFLKMADERAFLEDKAPNGADSNSKVLLGCSWPPYNQSSSVLAGYYWRRLSPSLALPRKRERGFFWGDEIVGHCRHTLEELGKQKGLQ
ncbi:MAG: hypothetical protein K8F27_15240 [Sulfuricellaceae bacterium]|nr:hypothetical protein [Sulfuricellaceae bacterium]